MPHPLVATDRRRFLVGAGASAVAIFSVDVAAEQVIKGERRPGCRRLRVASGSPTAIVLVCASNRFGFSLEFQPGLVIGLVIGLLVLLVLAPVL